MPDYTDYISFSGKCPISDANQFSLKVNKDTLKTVLATFGIIGEVVKDTQILVKKKPYNCPACNNE